MYVAPPIGGAPGHASVLKVNGVEMTAAAVNHGRCKVEWISRSSGLHLRCVLEESHESACRGVGGWREETEAVEPGPGDLAPPVGRDAWGNPRCFWVSDGVAACGKVEGLSVTGTYAPTRVGCADCKATLSFQTSLAGRECAHAFVPSRYLNGVKQFRCTKCSVEWPYDAVGFLERTRDAEESASKQTSPSPAEASNVFNDDRPLPRGAARYPSIPEEYFVEALEEALASPDKTPKIHAWLRRAFFRGEPRSLCTRRQAGAETECEFKQGHEGRCSWELGGVGDDVGDVRGVGGEDGARGTGDVQKESARSVERDGARIHAGGDRDAQNAGSDARRGRERNAGGPSVVGGSGVHVSELQNVRSDDGLRGAAEGSGGARERELTALKDRIVLALVAMADRYQGADRQAVRALNDALSFLEGLEAAGSSKAEIQPQDMAIARTALASLTERWREPKGHEAIEALAMFFATYRGSCVANSDVARRYRMALGLVSDAFQFTGNFRRMADELLEDYAKRESSR